MDTEILRMAKLDTPMNESLSLNATAMQEGLSYLCLTGCCNDGRLNNGYKHLRGEQLNTCIYYVFGLQP